MIKNKTEKDLKTKNTTITENPEEILGYSQGQGFLQTGEIECEPRQI